MFCRNEKRIVKVTRFDKSVGYMVQTKNFWGKWEDGSGYGMRDGIIYDKYEKALKEYNVRGTNSCTFEVILTD